MTQTVENTADFKVPAPVRSTQTPLSNRVISGSLTPILCREQSRSGKNKEERHGERSDDVTPERQGPFSRQKY